jgi:protein-glutamine gamma-glutamyltransferase
MVKAMPKLEVNAPLLWLILPLTLVVAPHLAALPAWIGLSWPIFSLLSLYAAANNKPWPTWLIILLALAGVAGVLLQFGTVIGPQGGVALLVYLSGAKLLETRSARDRTGLLFVGCFLLVAYFLNSQSLAMAAYMTLAVVALAAGLIANQLTSAEPRATAWTAVRLLLQALPLALVLFLLFPRLHGPLWGLPQQAAAQTGLSDRMSPGDFGQLIQSGEIAFRVDFNGVTPPASALYWRGPVLWDFDGRTWQSQRPSPPGPARGEPVGTPTRYAITLEPHRQNWLFLLGLPRELPVPDSALQSDLQWLSKSPINQRLRYIVSADLDYRLDAAGLDIPTRNRALELPPGNPQTRSLAAQWMADAADARTIVNRALAYFRQEAFFYTLQPPLLGEHSADDFLFLSRRGFCEHYTSAFVVLMRAAGVPARVVTGYQGGEPNPLGDYLIVRQRDAHAWAEVWLRGEGWVRIDPTAAVAPNRIERGLEAGLPPGERRAGLIGLEANWLAPLRLGWDLVNNRWNQWVLGYNQERQRQFLSRLNPLLANWQGMVWGLAILGGLALLFASMLMLPRSRRVRADAASRLYARFCRKLEKRGIARAATEGPADFAQRVNSQRPDLAEPVNRITQLYLASRYGIAETEQLLHLKLAIDRFKPTQSPR